MTIEQSGNIEGQRPWESKPNPEDKFAIEQQEHFAKQGSLPSRKKLNDGDGTTENVHGDQY